ncbi:MAG: hypothetical protein KAI24_04200 [Planctomycetes bacterium]|nr:hypothetical protein [Planctomycetota bacterium]
MSDPRRAPRTAHLALLLPALLGVAAAQAPRTPFPEGCATIEHLVLHFDTRYVDEWLPVYRDLSAALPNDVIVTIAVAGAEEAATLRRTVTDAGSRRYRVLEAGEPLTTWARDRMLAVGVSGSPADLLTPPEDRVDADYGGDLAVAKTWAQQNGGRTAAAKLWFEGGDIASNGTRLFVGWCSVMQNVGDDEAPVDAVVAFERLVALPTVVVGKPIAPHPHLDMYLTVLDERTVLVGDPIKGADLLRRIVDQGEYDSLPDFDDWSEDSQRAVVSLYSAVATEVRRVGLRAVRVPILHGDRGGIMTWNNALVERRAGVSRAYAPSYGVPVLDEAAHAVYRAAGCQVAPIDVAAIAPHGGTVRCLTNVVAWRRAPGS